MKFKYFHLVGLLLTSIIVGCSENQNSSPTSSNTLLLNQGIFTETTCGSIGDFVWHDINMNGIQDANEPGIAGVEVFLVSCDLTQSAGPVYTDANGYYLFSPVCYTGYLQVKFTIPNGYLVTLRHMGTNDGIDSDIDALGLTGCIFFDGNGGENNLTIDAGLYIPSSTGCSYTLGFWKTHPENWPVNSLSLGNVNYSKTQLLAILNKAVKGNGLITLSHQLIAAKLNIANGADPLIVQGTIDGADALIGNLVVPPIGSGYIHPRSTSNYEYILDQYNNGYIGPGHCSNNGDISE